MATPKPEVDPHELAQYAARISEHLKELEASVDQWREYRDDYKQLGQLLSTLPDKTSYDIMVPIGKLAFMPGRIVHTNEVLALLGDNWFADVSAKEAAEIVARRQQVVEENLSMVETQLNETNARAGAAPGVFKAEQYGLNEQGLPFMEIREELPDENGQDETSPSSVPNSVEAARKLQPLEKSKAEKLADQALLEKLKALELEEGDISDEDQEEKVAHDDDDDLDMLSDDYDTEIAENMFDQFDDDEEYAMDGVVDEEDYTYHDFQEEEAASDVEAMDTITTPSVQHAMDRAAADAPISMPVPDPSPLVDTVKERVEEPTLIVPGDVKGKKRTKPIIKPRVSRFKQNLAQQQAPTDEEKSPKKVSWGPDIIHEHQAAKPSQQVDEDELEIQQIPNEPVYNIRSPADIYHQLLDQRMAEQASQTDNEPVDVQSLLKDAAIMKETIYMPSERDIPQVTTSPKKKVSRFKQQRDQDRSSDSIASPPALQQSKLDTSTMRGAVVEKETEDVDLEEVEDNMLEKEVAAEYQRKRQNMIASQGGFSYANKPEFEVYDDELPLPSNDPKRSVPSVEVEEKPKRVSKFKAAKLASKAQRPQ
ncbi:hypothetical protein K450DRAFT_255208 [Umbelopsis ramanniana AG]|uniref:DUF3835 domain-containing protein n=1 Tax=Umbelopsis ramanniana AG TaxID=1314678 RepID=A0AAD5E461_UMBRA|nr:uncharacterized protein K450DRAFT_255208 [Umbelopsis ramanniana AG]KAI8576833.1 hypothetical protein K450DRAFT_255208 [Umbelopsis ramanniana AG]